MIEFCEIINQGTIIRIVTKNSDSQEFNQPIEFSIDAEVNTLEELVTAIKNYLENVNLDRSN